MLEPQVMEPKDKKPRPEQDSTDLSLREERDRTDDAFGRKRDAIEDKADAVVNSARANADVSLKGARDRADARLARSEAPPVERRTVNRERVVEDATLREERAISDEKLGEEREGSRRALASLVASEREATDQHLLIERTRSDETLAARDDFLGMVSHDLKTLLGGIAMRAGLLVRNASGDDAGQRTRRDAESIQRYTARMNRLIGDLVDVASIEAGRLSVAPQLDEATHLVRETVEAFQPAASARHLSLKSEVARDSLPARFDPERILQVLANLVSNAIKFTPEGGRISIRVEPVEEGLRFSVADSGPGIAEDQHERIFERFWQVLASDKRGLGLGLYISKGLVEAHGGRIWAESSPEAGSTFFFTLPGERTSG